MSDAHWNPYPIQPPLRMRDIEIHALHLTMRDGVKIAIDVFLPKNHPQDKPLPAILQATRYFRRSKIRQPFQNWMWEQRFAMQLSLLSNGYAYVSMDSRGTGASMGHWTGTWTEAEVRDYAEVMDWVIRQPWSDGTLGGVLPGNLWTSPLSSRRLSTRRVNSTLSVESAWMPHPV